jgi:hypothetical protein
VLLTTFRVLRDGYMRSNLALIGTEEEKAEEHNHKGKRRTGRERVEERRVEHRVGEPKKITRHDLDMTSKAKLWATASVRAPDRVDTSSAFAG